MEITHAQPQALNIQVSRVLSFSLSLEEEMFSPDSSTKQNIQDK
jgi:hypothetical protein